MKRWQMWAAVAVMGLVVTACVLFDQPGYYDADGIYHEPERGVVSVAADVATGAGATGIPYVGLIGTILGIVGGIGSWVQKRKKDANSAKYIELLSLLREGVKKVTTDKQFVDLIQSFKKEDPVFGAELQKSYEKAKKAAEAPMK